MTDTSEMMPSVLFVEFLVGENEAGLITRLGSNVATETVPKKRHPKRKKNNKKLKYNRERERERRSFVGGVLTACHSSAEEVEKVLLRRRRRVWASGDGTSLNKAPNWMDVNSSARHLEGYASRIVF